MPLIRMSHIDTEGAWLAERVTSVDLHMSPKEFYLVWELLHEGVRKAHIDRPRAAVAMLEDLKFEFYLIQTDGEFDPQEFLKGLDDEGGDS